MTRFLFELHRSQKKEDQAVNLRCASFIIKGEIDATSINAVKDRALRMMALPGVWHLILRNAEPGCEWQDLGRFDTRAPDQVPPSSSKRRAAGRQPSVKAPLVNTKDSKR